MNVASIGLKLIAIIEFALISYLVSRILNLRKSIVPISIITIILSSFTLYNVDQINFDDSYLLLISLNFFWMYILIHYYFFHTIDVKVEDKITNSSEKPSDNKEEEKKYNELSSRFVNIVDGSSRELRTIITTIVGSIGLLRETKLTELQQEYLSDLEKSTENLTSFVTNISTFIKADLRAFELNETTTFKIESIFDQLIGNYEILVESNGKIEVLYDIDKNVPDEIVGDEKYLRILLGCIIDNSIKFTNRGEIKLTCNLVHKSEDNCTLEILISDTGIGISEDRIPHIFTAMNNRKGNFWYAAGVDPGLGLPTAERLSRLFKNGKLDISSTINKGTTVTFKATFKLPKYTKVKKKIRSRIGIISEPKYARYMIKLLERKGHMNIENYEESQVNEFINSTKNAPPYDVIILCSKSYRKEPIENFLMKIKNIEHLENTKIILICTKYLLENFNFDDHIDFYLIKPFLINQLYKHIKHCLQSKSPGVPSKDSDEEVNSTKLTVLVAEDDIFNRQILTKIINTGGHTCIAVNNGLECLETYKNLGGKIDVIFMDYQMPSLNGLEATRLIRNYESVMNLDRTRIIGFTADEDMKQKCIGSGMDDCLLKPVMVPKVHSALKECAKEKN